ncbi:alkaline phosphatase PhoX [Geodermatophilus sp. URMC 64]
MTTSEQLPQTDSAVSRRSFLACGAATGLGIVLVGSVDTLFGATPAPARFGGPRGVGYGPLVPDPKGVLSLPEGFRYTVVAQTGVTTLDSGHPTPADPDGAASFPRRGGGSVLVYNHEVGGDEANPVPAIPGLVYDAGARGGCTTLEVDRDGRRIREYVSIAGTVNNCAGGVTPWDTWLTCEETEAVPTATNGLQQRHGYVFEVDPYDQSANREPKPIKAFGRYAHEAVVIDPRENRAHLTEDAGNPNGLLYRWTAPRGVRLGERVLRTLGSDEGTLEAMRALDRGTHVPDLSVATAIGTTYRVEWVTVPDRDATTTPTRSQDYARPITRSRKLEGMWRADGGAYVVASFARTSDGSAAEHDGQVWFLDPEKNTITLKLRFAYTPADQDGDPDGPDNITVSPFGGVIIAEDGEGAQHLLGATDRGEAFFFARNDVNDAEFTGPHFSPDKKILFTNIQGDGSPGNPGYVFAITGPFRHQG